MKVNEFTAGFLLGLMIGMTVALIINTVWYRNAKNINEEWLKTTIEIIESYHEFCDELLKNTCEEEEGENKWTLSSENGEPDERQN